MSKRVQYAQSLPVLSANPAAEAGRTVFYALSDGLYARRADGVIVGPLAGSGPSLVGGAIPSSRVALPTPSSVQMGATGQAGSFEDIPGLSTSVTSAAAVPLFVLANLAVSTVSGNSAVEVGVRVVVDAVPEELGNATRVIIPRAAELNATSASLLTTTLPPGTYTARVQWRRVSGTFIPEITTGSTFLQAQQAPKGDKGEPGVDGTDGAPGTPGAPGAPGGVTLDTAQTITGAKTYGVGKLLMTSSLATGAEPYSDANPPDSLWVTEQAGVPPNPPSGISVLYTDLAGRMYVKNSSGTVVEITNQAGGGGTGGAADVKDVVIDFGTVPTSTRSFVIADASITATSQVVVTQSGRAVLGRSADENEMDPLLCRAVPAAGQMTVYATALDGPVKGAYPINYLVG